MYKFTNKTTGEIKFGNLSLAGEGYDEFTCEDGTVITVQNKEMDGSNLSNEEYDIELYGGQPTGNPEKESE